MCGFVATILALCTHTNALILVFILFDPYCSARRGYFGSDSTEPFLVNAYACENGKDSASAYLELMA